MHFSDIQWEKKGLIIKPSKEIWWMQSHAMMPTPLKIDRSLYKIYFAGRNKKNQSHIGYVILDIENPTKIIEYSTEPVLAPGRLGTFDDNVVLHSCIIKKNDLLYMYTIGFKPGGTTRMDLFGGLAISQDNGKTFSRWTEAPIIERNKKNPYINTAPWVLKIKNNFVMYYVAGIEWLNPNLPRYNIQIATSNDGKSWKREGKIAIDFIAGENALARPYVIKEKDTYKMLFSSKGNYYLPQYAESKDGYTWIRSKNALKIRPSKEGPDEEMICYPIVLNHHGKYLMLYNGNGYGQNGICLAVEK